jgi:hypothetical protein
MVSKLEKPRVYRLGRGDEVERKPRRYFCIAYDALEV